MEGLPGGVIAASAAFSPIATPARALALRYRPCRACSFLESRLFAGNVSAHFIGTVPPPNLRCLRSDAGSQVLSYRRSRS